MCRKLWLIVLTLALTALSACGGGGASTVVPPIGLGVAPVLAGDVDGKAASSLWSSPAAEMLLKVTATNANNAKAQVSLIRFCLKHDAMQDDPLTAEEALSYLDPLSGNPPANVDVVEFGFANLGNNASQKYEFPKFKGQDFARDERYWISAVFADTQGRVSPPSEPQRFKLLPAYPLLKAPKLAIEKTFTGEVRDLSGALLAGALVAYFHKGEFTEAGLTGQDGRYCFRAEVANPHSGSAVSVGEASGRGLADGETQYVLKAYASAYPDSEVVAYLNGEYKDYEVSFSFREANQLPVAVLLADPQQGVAPLSVAFDGSGSADPDGQVVQYDYDWESDGHYDAVDAGANATHIYIDPGSYTATLRVWDDRGACNTASVSVEVREAGGDAICFSALENGQWGIYLMNEDGSEPHKICDLESNTDGDLAWSPDHNKIAYQDGVGMSTNLWVVNADGTGKRQVTTSAGTTPYWEDNEYILYTMYVQGSDQYDLARVKDDGTENQVIYSINDGHPTGYPYLSPDAKQISYVQSEYYGALYRLSIADYPSFAGAHTIDAEGTHDNQMSWSVKNEICWCTFYGAMYKIASDGTGQTLINSGYIDYYPSPSPDGNIYIFTNLGAGSVYQIWKANVDGTNRTQLTNNEDTRGSDWWHPRLPKASLSANPIHGTFPLTVSFDATASYDMDNGTGDGLGIARYQWDWDGDGTYDFNSGTDPTVNHTYNNPGSYEAVVKIADDEGQSNSASIIVE
jgi:PKD repeat protein